MTNERTAIAALGASLAGVIAVAHPSLIPALTLAAAAWVVFATYLRL
ncbi:hypothetical protein [Streptomyces sp. NBC_01637]|nr:hypothetical protein OH719_32245 [Streptomyces sp. NBC_01653]WTD88744.1 hypothetical protein OG891_14625 [Streptomyces sp. NBC_01637]